MPPTTELLALKRGVLLLALDYSIPYVDLMGIKWDRPEQLQPYCNVLIQELQRYRNSLPSDWLMSSPVRQVIYNWSMEIINENSIWGGLYFRREASLKVLQAELDPAIGSALPLILNEALETVGNSKDIRILEEGRPLNSHDQSRVLLSGFTHDENEAVGCITSFIETACRLAEIKKSFTGFAESLSIEPRKRFWSSLNELGRE